MNGETSFAVAFLGDNNAAAFRAGVFGARAERLIDFVAAFDEELAAVMSRVYNGETTGITRSTVSLSKMFKRLGVWRHLDYSDDSVLHVVEVPLAALSLPTAPALGPEAVAVYIRLAIAGNVPPAYMVQMMSAGVSPSDVVRAYAGDVPLEYLDVSPLVA